MPRLLSIAVVVFLSLVFLAGEGSEAYADRRVALVVGNSKYNDANLALANPSNDAADMAATLTKLGFEVTVALNATTGEMDRAIRRFGDAVSNADVSLFYYAGHALQFEGNNYLMPVDARLDDEVDLNRNTVSDEQVRKALDRGNGIKIMILDACRNNPLADRFKRSVLGSTRAVELTRGLARIDKAQGMVVAYAAAAGQVALDGNNKRNSPFTGSLIRWMQEPALEISTMMRRVTNDVLEATHGQQRPEYSSTLRNDYFFDPLADRHFWDRIRATNDAAALREFINQFPSSPLVFEARARLDVLDRARRERDEQARLERERVITDQARRQACERDNSELAIIGDDLAKLETFAQRATCDEARANAKEKIKAIMAQREDAARREEARHREEEAKLKAEVCNNETAIIDAIKDDINQLQDFLQKATCEAARSLATERIHSVVAQREAAEKERQETERTCRIEQRALVAIWDDLSAIQVFLPQIKCEQVRATASERAKAGIAQREREESEARQQAVRNCQDEQAIAQSIWDEIARLREFANCSICQEVRSTVNARIDVLQAEEQRQKLAQQEAAKKLAALEEERARQRREEGERRQAEQARQQSEARCKSDIAELTSLEADAGKLRQFSKQSICEEARKLASEKVALIEREEKTCRDENSQRIALLGQVKTQNDRTRLGRSKEEMVKLQLESTCARLAPSFMDAIGMIRVKIAQVELRRMGCFSGTPDGLLNDATRDAATLFLATVGNPDSDAKIDEGLLSDLNSHNDPVCKPASPPAVVHTERKPEPRSKQASRPPARERPRERGREAPARSSTRAEVTRVRPPPVQAAPHASGGTSGPGMIIIGH